MNKGFFEVTKSFPEIDSLLTKSRELKKELNKVNRRLRTKQIEYDFLQKLIWEFSFDNVLVDTLHTCFENLGYEVEKLAGDNEEDLQITSGDTLILIEAKGDKSENTSYKGSDQILRYVTRRKSEIKDKVIHGIHIVNHHLKQPDFRKRNPKAFGTDMIKDAEAGKFGLLTTVELLNGYVKLKRKELSIEGFDGTIKSSGHIKF